MVIAILLICGPTTSFAANTKVKKPKTGNLASTQQANEPYLAFFSTLEEKPMLGLSCASEPECKARCNGSEICQKPIDTCLNCVGAKSPQLNDFFSKVGDLTVACFDESWITSDIELLFKAVPIIPITPGSAYNPQSLKDVNLALKFMQLCPVGSTAEPVVVGFVDPITHNLNNVPMVICGNKVYPLVGPIEDCAKKSEWIDAYIHTAVYNQNGLQADYENAVSMGDRLPLKYDVLKLTDYTEAQYLRCNPESIKVCQKVCNSRLSCSIPLDNSTTAAAISANDSFAFSAQSLSQIYDLPADTGGFNDFRVIDSILKDFSDVFVAQQDSSDPSVTSFLVSSSYRERLKNQMQAFCDPNTNPIIFGRAGKIERVFCRSDVNGYFQILVNLNEDCYQKRNDLDHPAQGNNDQNKGTWGIDK